MQSQLNDIRVGMTASLSGRYRPQGYQALIGVQTWVADTNRAGGMKIGATAAPRPVRLLFYDDASDATECGSLTERLIVTDQVDILLGPYSSGLALQAATVANCYQHVLWNHGGALEDTTASSWVVGLLTPASQYFHGVIDMVRQTGPAANRIAIVHSTAGAFPRTVATGAKRYGQEQGFAIVGTYAYPLGTADFTPLFGQLAQAQPQIILSVGRIEDDIRFATQYVRSALQATVIGLIATPLLQFRDILGTAAAGFVGPSQWEPGVIAKPAYGPTAEEVLQRLTARHPAGVDYPMAQAYAAGLIAQQCIEVAGTLEQTTLLHSARQLDCTTFYGRYKLDADSGRQVGHVMPVVQWHGERKIIIWPPHQSR